MLKFFLLTFSLVPGISTTAQYKIAHAFNLHENPAIIEGMSYDPVGKHFYFGESISKKILRYDLSGKPAGSINAAKDGLTSVLGSSVDIKKHHLWICGATDTGTKKRMCMFLYDLKTGNLISKLPDTSGNAKLFNDIAVTSDGSAFVTDTYTKAIYKADVSENIMIKFLQSDLLSDPNGITSSHDTLYVSTTRGIVRINTSNKEVTTLPLQDFMIAGIDGLYYYNNSLIGIQNVLYPVTIVRYYLDNSQNKLSRARVLSSADPSFAIPTTGAIVDDNFYFMANNNIGKEDSLKTDGGVSMKLKPVTIYRVSLKK